MKNIFRPYEIKEKLIRLGNKLQDGGYSLCNTIIENTDVLYTYGAGNDVSFEEDFFKITNKKIHIYDMTVEKPKNLNDDIIFHKEGLSGFKSNNTNNFLNHLKINKDENKNILLKIDVEYNEYEWMENTNLNEIQKNTIAIIIEFHRLKEKRFELNLNKLKEYYNIIWIHQNNCGGYFKYNNNMLPNCIEITLIRKDFNICKKLSKKTFPLNIDVPNCKDFKEHKVYYNEIKLL